MCATLWATLSRDLLCCLHYVVWPSLHLSQTLCPSECNIKLKLPKWYAMHNLRMLGSWRVWMLLHAQQRNRNHTRMLQEECSLGNSRRIIWVHNTVEHTRRTPSKAVLSSWVQHHHCWVEIHWDKDSSQWEGYWIAGEDLGLDIYEDKIIEAYRELLVPVVGMWVMSQNPTTPILGLTKTNYNTPRMSNKVQMNHKSSNRSYCIVQGILIITATMYRLLKPYWIHTHQRKRQKLGFLE